MEKKVTLDRVIAFLRVYLKFACCWPLSPSATRLQRFLHSAFRYFCYANSTIFIVAVIWTISKHKDYMVLMKLGCELSAALQILLQLILFAMQDKRLQFIVLEIEDCYQRAQKYEKEIFQHYIDRCKLFYVLLIWKQNYGRKVFCCFRFVYCFVIADFYPSVFVRLFSDTHTTFIMLFFYFCLVCGIRFRERQCIPLCHLCKREPVVGLELPSDSMARACAAVYRSPDTPYSLRITLNIITGRRTVTEVVPWPEWDIPSIPLKCAVKAFEEGCTFPYYGPLPKFLLRYENIDPVLCNDYEILCFSRFLNSNLELSDKGSIFCWVIMAGISMIATPLFSPQPFPSAAEYPFDVQHQPLRTIIYAHHMLTIYQSVTQVSANSFPALLLWFIAARFHILSERYRTMTNMKEFIKYTREHYILLRYAKEVTLAIRYIALLCVTFSIGAVIFGYLTFVSKQPWSVKWTYLMIASGGFIELYMYAWPADNVMSTSTDIASAVYDSLWYNDNLAMRKLLTYVILRSQHPVTVSIPCALPNLSMNYYASYVSTVFSYMAFVRILMDQE